MFSVCLENLSNGAFRWFNIGDAEELSEAVTDIKGKYDSEVIVADYEEISFKYISCIYEAIEALEELDNHDRELALNIVRNSHYDIEEAVRAIKNGAHFVVWEARDEEDAVAGYLEQTGALSGIPNDMRNYFDYEKYARDMGYNGADFIEISGGMVIIFPH